MGNNIFYDDSYKPKRIFGSFFLRTLIRVLTLTIFLYAVVGLSDIGHNNDASFWQILNISIFAISIIEIIENLTNSIYLRMKMKKMEA